jgi:ribonuclease HI
VARLLTLPDNHPVLQLCPNTFPKTLDREEGEETSANLTPWHMQNPLKPRYESRLTKALSSVNDIMQPQTTVETINDNVAPPWKTMKALDIHIPTGTKTKTAEQHKEHHRSTLHDKKHLCLYTDGSLLEGRAGAGVHASRAGRVVYQSQHYLGQEMEVFDAELYGIAKAAEAAVKLAKQEETTDVWIFCDNQAAVRRMSTTVAQPGQQYILNAHQHAITLHTMNIHTHIHWVPGHVEVEGNEKADQLAKNGTQRKRKERDAYTSITYIKRRIREKAMETWKKRWPSMKTGRSYQGKPGRNIHPLMRYHQSRKLISTIIQLRTGHGYTRAYLSRIPSTEIESPACTCGYHHQTPKHLLLECRLYNTERKQLKRDIRPLTLTWQTAMHTTRGLQATMTFLQSTGTGTRSWMMGPKDMLLESAGWREYDRGEDENGRTLGEEYIEEAWHDQAEVAEGGGDPAGVG